MTKRILSALDNLGRIPLTGVRGDRKAAKEWFDKAIDIKEKPD